MASSLPASTEETPSGPRRIRGIIFDLDGTLLDTEALSDEAMWTTLDPWVVRTTLSADGDSSSPIRRLPWALKKQILGLRGSEWAPIVVNYFTNEENDSSAAAAAASWTVSSAHATPDPATVWSSWEQHLSDLSPRVEACPGAAALVERFAREGLPMAIATSSRRSSVDKKRRNHGGMFAHIGHIVTGDDPAVVRGKPAPDIFLEAARQLGLEPNECVVFEDAWTGVCSGKAAGCLVVAVPDRRFDASETARFKQHADLVLESLEDFSWENLAHVAVVETDTE